MIRYREFQFSWLITIVLLPFQGWLVYSYLNNLGNRPMPLEIFLILTGLFVLIYLTFCGMTTRIGPEIIKISFGIGLFRKKISLRRIASVEVSRSPWYYGYGIRLIPNGWMYNVSGPHSVELTFTDRDRVIRIGTQDPQRLKQEIDSRLNREVHVHN